MLLFYTPDITPSDYTLGQEESKHCIRVLRLTPGDTIHLTDGRGNLHTAKIVEADARRCRVEVVATAAEFGKRPYRLTMAVAPTKNIERYEWFLEKATEIGCDEFIPLECDHSERRVIKPEREMRVVTSAVKQSLKAYHPALEPMTALREVLARPFGGVKLIAHCNDPIVRKSFISDCVRPGEETLVMIGPEGDFTPQEVAAAVEAGFREITLGDARLRTETAALVAVTEVAALNRKV